MADRYNLTQREYIALGFESKVANALVEQQGNTARNTENVDQALTDIEQINNEITVINGQIDTINDQIATINQNIGTLQMQVATLQQDVTDLTVRVQTNETDIAQAQQDIITLQGQVTTIQQDLTALTNRVSTNELSISDLENDVIDIQTDILDLQNQQSSYQSQSSAITIPANGSLDVFTYANVATGLHGITAMCDTIDADVTLDVTVNAVSAFSLVLTERTTTPQVPANITATGINIVLTLTNSSATPKNVSPFVSLSVIRF